MDKNKLSGGDISPLKAYTMWSRSPFSANIETDVELLVPGGSIATYATGNFSPSLPFWPLVFKNVRIFFLGSDDFSSEAKALAARALNDALDGEWQGFEIGECLPLRSIVQAHESVETRRGLGRVVVHCNVHHRWPHRAMQRDHHKPSPGSILIVRPGDGL